MQGFNMGRYHPPSSLDPALSSTKTGGFNSQGHPLGARAKNLATEGALTVRFEMPFRIWCENCKPESIIDQGVRFNAEKKKVGKYYSSPIWAFRMKHTACGGIIEIRTDPQNSKYVVTEGGRMRNYGEEITTEGAFGEIITEEERARRKGDAMAALEGKTKEKETVKSEAKIVEDLLEHRRKHWDDVYTNNQRLRKTARAERKVQARLRQDRESVAEKFGLGMELLDVSREDEDRAALVDFGIADSRGDKTIARTTQRPLFMPHTSKSRIPSKESALGKTKSEVKAERSRALFQQELQGNTRAALDPFLTGGHTKPISVPGVKRRKLLVDSGGSNEAEIRASPQTGEETLSAVTPSNSIIALVAYGSDDE